MSTRWPLFIFFFFFNDTATTEIYTLSLHDALPISRGGDPARRGTSGRRNRAGPGPRAGGSGLSCRRAAAARGRARSEEHTSELQSPCNLVCRLLLEKKKKYNTTATPVVRAPCGRVY